MVHVRIVFERLKQYGLVINVSKSHFAKSEVDFLGYLVNSEGIRPLPSRVQAVLNYSRPTTVKDLRRFLALINVYKRFIPNAVDLQSDLRKMKPGNKKMIRARSNEIIRLNWLLSGVSGH